MRAGLKIDKLAFARAGKVVLRLALFPMLFEALVDAGLYYWSVFNQLINTNAGPSRAYELQHACAVNFEARSSMSRCA